VAEFWQQSWDFASPANMFFFLLSKLGFQLDKISKFDQQVLA
jgi:hypothetical protein